MTTAIKIVSDLICPWCFVGKRRLEAALRQLPGRRAVEVSWHPFQLNPDMPREGMDRKEYCMRKFGRWERCLEMYAQIAAVGKTVGIDFNFKAQPRVPNTVDAHRVIWLAGKDRVQDAVVEALFAAYFCQGVDLSDRNELVEVASDGGLDRRCVEDLLASNEAVGEVLSEENEIKLLGVTSVPLFIIDDRVAISGAQPPETLLKVIERARATYPKRQKLAQETVKPAGPEGCHV